MLQFDHYLITLYNSPLINILTAQHRGLGAWGAFYDREGEKKRLSPLWLEHRAELFNKFTLPSVTYQSSKNFTWLVIFDEKTPIDYINTLNRNKTFIPLRVDAVNSRSIMFNYIKQNSSNRWLLSTNLDSDDAISINFIETIQKNIVYKNQILVSNNGVKLKLPENVSLNVRYSSEKVNHFYSILSSNGLLCIDKMHNELNKSILPITINNTCSWLEVVHGDNLSNKIKLSNKDQLQKFAKLAHLFGFNPKDFPCDIVTNSKGNINKKMFQDYINEKAPNI